MFLLNEPNGIYFSILVCIFFVITELLIIKYKKQIFDFFMIDYEFLNFLVINALNLLLSLVLGFIIGGLIDFLLKSPIIVTMSIIVFIFICGIKYLIWKYFIKEE